MYRLNALRTLLVICTLAFTAAAQTGAALGGGGIIGGEKGNVTTVNQSPPTPSSGITFVGGRDGTAAGSGAALNSDSYLALTILIALVINGMH